MPESIPQEHARKYSTGMHPKAFHLKIHPKASTDICSKTLRCPKAFHWNVPESSPLEYAWKHSTGKRLKAFHWETLESIQREYTRKHSKGIHPKAFHGFQIYTKGGKRPKAFHWFQVCTKVVYQSKLLGVFSSEMLWDAFQWNTFWRVPVECFRA